MHLQEIFELISARDLGSVLTFRNPTDGTMIIEDIYKISFMSFHYDPSNSILLYSGFTDHENSQTRAIAAEDYDLFEGVDTSNFVQHESYYLELLTNLFDKIQYNKNALKILSDPKVLSNQIPLESFYSHWSLYPHKVTC